VRAREAATASANIPELKPVSIFNKTPLYGRAPHCGVASAQASTNIHRQPYRITTNKTNPATNTTTGTQNCTSVKTLTKKLRSLSIANLFHP
jgi:hypothetical protein